MITGDWVAGIRSFLTLSRSTVVCWTRFPKCIRQCDAPLQLRTKRQKGHVRDQSRSGPRHDQALPAAVRICEWTALSHVYHSVPLAAYQTSPTVHNYANLSLVLLRTVRFYRKVSGECPVEAFLERLPQKTAAKVLAVLKLRGTELFEVRVLASKQAYRFPCFFAGETLVVLTHGFDKKTEKTPKAEIRRAEAYRDDFLRRQRNE